MEDLNKLTTDLVELLRIERRVNLNQATKEDVATLKILATNFDSPRACMLYGRLLYEGVVIERDKAEALKFFKFVYDHGNFEVLSELSFLLINDEEDKVKLFLVDCLKKAKDEFEMMFELMKEDEVIAEA